VKRSEALAALSRDHHVALFHALRLRRAGPDDLAGVVAAFLAFLAGPAREHFDQEEAILAPELPPDSGHLAARMLDEHAEILRRGRRLGADPDLEAASELGALLSAHVRFEERELFPVLERGLSPERLREVAVRLGHARS
jgi:hypothetical protein